MTLTTSSAYVPQLNRHLEGLNGIFLVEARSMIHLNGLTLAFWAEVTGHAVDLHHRLMTVEQGSRTLMEVLLETSPNNAKRRVLSCVAFAYIHE